MMLSISVVKFIYIHVVHSSAAHGAGHRLVYNAYRRWKIHFCPKTNEITTFIYRALLTSLRSRSIKKKKTEKKQKEMNPPYGCHRIEANKH